MLFMAGFLCLLSGCTPRHDSMSHDEIIKADLHAIIELQGSSCGEVSSYQLNDDHEYLVVCETGDVYRIHISQEGHINVNAHED